MKTPNWLTWFFVLVAMVLMLFGLINFLIGGGFLGVIHSANYFHVANSMLLLTLTLKFLEYMSSKKSD